MADKCVACGEVAEGKPLYKKLGPNDCKVEVFTALHEMQLLSLQPEEKNRRYICWDCDETIAEEYATFISTEAKKKAVEAKRKQQDEVRKVKLQKKLKQAFKKAHDDKLKASGVLPPVSKYKMKEKEREENRYHASFCLLCKAAFETYSNSRGYQRFTLHKMVDDDFDIGDVLQKLGLKMDITAEMKRKRFVCCQCYNKIRRNYKAINRGEVASPLPLPSQESIDELDIFKRRPTTEEHAAEIAKLIPPSLANLYKVVTNEDGLDTTPVNGSKVADSSTKGEQKSKRSRRKNPKYSSDQHDSDSDSSNSDPVSHRQLENGIANSHKSKINNYLKEKWKKVEKEKKAPLKMSLVPEPPRTPTIRTLLPKGANEFGGYDSDVSTPISLISGNAEIVDFGICNICGLGYNGRPKDFWYKLNQNMPSVAGVTILKAFQILESELAEVSRSVRDKELVCKPCFSRVCKGFRSQILQQIAEKKGVDVNKLELTKLKVKMINNVELKDKNEDPKRLNGALNNNNISNKNKNKIKKIEAKNEKTDFTKPSPKFSSNQNSNLNGDTEKTECAAAAETVHKKSPQKRSLGPRGEKIYKFIRCSKTFKKTLACLKSDFELINLINDSQHLRYKGKVVLLSSVLVDLADLKGILHKSTLINFETVHLEFYRDIYQFTNFRRNLKNRKDWDQCIVCQKEALNIEQTTRWLEDPVAPPNLMVPLRWAHLSITEPKPDSRVNYATDDGKVCKICHTTLKREFGKFVGSRVATSHGLNSESVALDKYKVSFDSVAMNIVADPLNVPAKKDTIKKHKEKSDVISSHDGNEELHVEKLPSQVLGKSDEAEKEKKDIENEAMIGDEAGKEALLAAADKEMDRSSDSLNLRMSCDSIEANQVDNEEKNLSNITEVGDRSRCSEDKNPTESHCTKKDALLNDPLSQTEANLNIKEQSAEETESKILKNLSSEEGKDSEIIGGSTTMTEQSNISTDGHNHNSHINQDTLSMDLHLSDTGSEDEADGVGTTSNPNSEKPDKGEEQVVENHDHIGESENSIVNACDSVDSSEITKEKYINEDQSKLDKNSVSSNSNNDVAPSSTEDNQSVNKNIEECDQGVKKNIEECDQGVKKNTEECDQGVKKNTEECDQGVKNTEECDQGVKKNTKECDQGAKKNTEECDSTSTSESSSSTMENSSKDLNQPLDSSQTCSEIVNKNTEDSTTSERLFDNPSESENLEINKTSHSLIGQDHVTVTQSEELVSPIALESGQKALEEESRTRKRKNSETSANEPKKKCLEASKVVNIQDEVVLKAVNDLEPVSKCGHAVSSAAIEDSLPGHADAIDVEHEENIISETNAVSSTENDQSILRTSLEQSKQNGDSSLEKESQVSLHVQSCTNKRKSTGDEAYSSANESELLLGFSDSFMASMQEEEEHELGEDNIAPFAQRKKFRGRNQNIENQISEREALQNCLDEIWHTIQSISLDDLVCEGVEVPLKLAQYNVGFLLALNDLRVHLGASLEDLIVWNEKLLPVELRERGMKPSMEKFSMYLLSLSNSSDDLSSKFLKQVIPEEMFHVPKASLCGTNQERIVSKCYIEDFMEPQAKISPIKDKISPIKWEDFLAPVNLDDLIAGRPSRVSWNDFNNGLLYALWKVNNLMNESNENFIKWLSLTSTTVMKDKDYIAMSKAVFAIDSHLQHYPDEINRLVAPIVVRSGACSKAEDSSTDKDVNLSTNEKVINDDDVIVEQIVPTSTTLKKNTVGVGGVSQTFETSNLSSIRKLARVLPQPPVDANDESQDIPLSYGPNISNVIGCNEENVDSDVRGNLSSMGQLTSNPIVQSPCLPEYNKPYSSVEQRLHSHTNVGSPNNFANQLSFETDAMNRQMSNTVNHPVKMIVKLNPSQPTCGNSLPPPSGTLMAPVVENATNPSIQYQNNPHLPIPLVAVRPTYSPVPSSVPSGVPLIPVISSTGYMTMVPLSVKIPPTTSSTGFRPRFSSMMPLAVQQVSNQTPVHLNQVISHSPHLYSDVSSTPPFNANTNTSEVELASKVNNLEKQLQEIQKQNSKLLELNQKLLEKTIQNSISGSQDTPESSVQLPSPSGDPQPGTTQINSVLHEASSNINHNKQRKTHNKTSTSKAKSKQSFEDALNYNYKI